MKIGYARVSTDDQKLDMQLDALTKAGCEIIHRDSVSGSTTKRPGLDRCLSSLKPGDTLCVYKLDRLGRSTVHLCGLLDEFGKEGIHFQSLSESINTDSPYGTALFGMLAVFAQLERSVIRERVRNGISSYRKRNDKWGARKIDIEIDHDMSISDLAKKHGVSRGTIYRIMKDKK